MKKILALCLSLILVVSSLAMTVSAAEKITVTVPAETIADQNFYDNSTGTAAALTAVPDGWTLAGTYTFGTNGIRATDHNGFSIYKNDAFDTKGADYTFSVTMATYSGASYIHFGAQNTTDAKKDGVADTGYTLYTKVKSDYKSAEYILYKNGTAIEGLTLTDTNTSYGYQSNRTFTFKVTSTGLTITGPFTGSPLTVADAEPITTGYIGARIRDNNGTKGNLKAMSLKTDEYSYEMDKPAEVVTGASATYSKPGASYMDYDLRGAAAVPSGVTPGASYSLGASGLTWSGNPNNTTSFGTAEVPSDISNFTVEARYTAKYNGSPVFNFLGYKLSKSGNYNTDKTYTLTKGTETLGTGTLGTSYVAGSVLVKVTFAGNNITVNVDGNDVITATDANVSKTGTVSIASGYTGAWTIGNVKIASPATNVTKTNFLMDKTFSTNDTIASLTADGYAISGCFTTTTANGIDGSAAAATGTVRYDGAAFEGGYTAEVVFWCADNVPSVYFNRVDSNNYYQITTKRDSSTGYGYLTLTKSVKNADDAEATVTTLIDSARNTVGTMLSIEGTYVIKLTILDDESMDIEITAKSYSGSVCAFDKVNDPTPITSGKLQYSAGYSRAGYTSYLKSMKVYPTPAEGADAVAYTGAFQVGSTAVNEMTKGNTFFTFPVAMVGQTPDFIAVLYEDYEMTDIKIIDTLDMNEGIVNLFDTSASTSDNISINVFVWNTLEGMVPVLESYVLD